MRRALLAVLVALAAACSDDEGDGAAVASTTTTDAPAPTTTAAVPAPTSTAVAAPACPSELAAPTESLTYALELDGVAGDDAATASLADDGWHLQVVLGDGGAADELLTTAPTDLARVVGPIDLDGNGTQELWVQVGTGAAATVVGLFRLDGCDLEPVLLDGTPAEFAIGGTVTLLQGLACGAADVTHLGATSEDGFTYATLERTYVLQGGELVAVGDETGTLAADDPELAAYSDFGC